jgi:hypothetical protein
LGIPNFGSNFWDPHWKQNSDPFSMPDILVSFVLNSAVEKMSNWNSDSKIWNFEKIYVGTQYTSFCTREKVAAIPTSTQNIYSKRLQAYLHLLKTVAAIPISTQNKLIGSWGRRSIAVAGEVTVHGRAHPYSWSITIVSLRSKESEE